MIDSGRWVAELMDYQNLHELCALRQDEWSKLEAERKPPWSWTGELPCSSHVIVLRVNPLK